MNFKRVNLTNELISILTYARSATDFLYILLFVVFLFGFGTLTETMLIIYTTTTISTAGLH